MGKRLRLFIGCLTALFLALAGALIAAEGGGEQDKLKSDSRSAGETNYPKVRERRDRLERLKKSSKLHYELFYKHYDHALEAMLQTENIDMVDEVLGMTALGLAAKDESADAIDMVQPLVMKFRADPNTVDSKGFTALHYASYVGNYAVVELLVNNGADVNLANSKIKGSAITPLYMAYQKGRTRIANFLKLRGAEDVDPAIRQQLDFAAALSQAAEKLRNLPPGVDPRKALRYRFESLGNAAIAELQAQGNFEAIAQWHTMKDRLLRALEQTPRDPGMTKNEIVQAVLRNALTLGPMNQNSAETEKTTEQN